MLHLAFVSVSCRQGEENRQKGRDPRERNTNREAGANFWMAWQAANTGFPLIIKCFTLDGPYSMQTLLPLHPDINIRLSVIIRQRLTEHMGDMESSSRTLFSPFSHSISGPEGRPLL